ncbi:MAG TPA: DHA2 family efflux MFS transporter permease subunit [Candidatus Dormibacteraeota bacterium]|nr:DHA2 family efflux MFS transporter permease subunit [Candidatus Dormibacteraeota bacterium]
MTRMRGNPWVVLVVLCLGFFMVLLDLTIVNIAIPAIIGGLKASLDQILWVINAYTLTYAVLLITAGRLGDRFGQRNMFSVGLVIFTASSAVCGVAQDPTALILARIVQGIGGALLTPQTLAIITTIFPRERRGAAFGVWGAVAGLATIAGPTLGGALVSYVDWRWVFYLNVPIGIITFILSLVLIPDLRPNRRPPVEPVGVVLASAGLFCIVYGLIEGQTYDWGVVKTIARQPITIPEIIAVGVILLAVFMLWDRTRPMPLVPTALFRDRNFAIMNWISATINFGLIGVFLVLTLFLQSALHFSAIDAGLTLVPISLLSMVVAPLAGRVADKEWGRFALPFGLICFAGGVGYIDWQANLNSNWWSLLPGSVIAGLGMGCTFAPMTTVAMRNVAPQLAGSASSVLNTIRQLGGAIGSAVTGAVLENQLSSTLTAQASHYAGQLPAAARAPFIAAFRKMASGGFTIGGTTTSVSGLGKLPPQVAAQIGELAKLVFAHGFIDAMHPTIVVSVVALALGAVSGLFTEGYSRKRRPAALPSGVSRTAEAQRVLSQGLAMAAAAASLQEGHKPTVEVDAEVVRQLLRAVAVSRLEQGASLTAEGRLEERPKAKSIDEAAFEASLRIARSVLSGASTQETREKAARLLGGNRH